MPTTPTGWHGNLIDLKRDATAQVTSISSTLPSSSPPRGHHVALHNGVPKVMTPKEMLRHYIDFQCEVSRRTIRAALAKERAHIWKVWHCSDNIDEVIDIFRTPPSSRQGALGGAVWPSDEQATAIQMTIGRLTGLRAKSWKMNY